MHHLPTAVHDRIGTAPFSMQTDMQGQACRGLFSKSDTTWTSPMKKRHTSCYFPPCFDRHWVCLFFISSLSQLTLCTLKTFLLVLKNLTEFKLKVADQPFDYFDLSFKVGGGGVCHQQHQLWKTFRASQCGGTAFLFKWLSPSRFLPYAADRGRVSAIGECVLTKLVSRFIVCAYYKSLLIYKSISMWHVYLYLHQ